MKKCLFVLVLVFMSITVMAQQYGITGYVKTTDGTPVPLAIIHADGLDITYSQDSGQYIMLVPVGWNGTVYCEKEGYTFTPSSRYYSNITEPVLEEDFLAVATGLVLSEREATINEGTSKTVTVKLPEQPVDEVTVTLTSMGADNIQLISPAQLTFSTHNWNEWQNITIHAVIDNNIYDSGAIITCSATGYDDATIEVTELDTNTPPSDGGGGGGCSTSMGNTNLVTCILLFTLLVFMKNPIRKTINITQP